MFKFLIVVLALVAYVAASGDEANAQIKSLVSDVRADGFDIALDTSNGISQSSSGDVHGNIHGTYEWVSPEGVHVLVKYVADENGYQPQSDLLPTPPPIPAEILKSLAWLDAHPDKSVQKRSVRSYRTAARN